MAKVKLTSSDAQVRVCSTAADHPLANARALCSVLPLLPFPARLTTFVGDFWVWVLPSTGCQGAGWPCFQLSRRGPRPRASHARVRVLRGSPLRALPLLPLLLQRRFVPNTKHTANTLRTPPPTLLLCKQRMHTTDVRGR